MDRLNIYHWMSKNGTLPQTTINQLIKQKSPLHIAFHQRKDFEFKYQVFRSPCLILIDHQDQIVWHQDYPLIEVIPLKLD
jgi:hypothetical protein